MIVDTNGKIVFMGHPANRPNLVKDFDDLLDGKTLTGVKEKGDGGDDEEEDGDGDAATVTTDEIKAQLEQIGKFADVAKNL